jgi:hypothetical protein
MRAAAVVADSEDPFHFHLPFSRPACGALVAAVSAPQAGRLNVRRTHRAIHPFFPRTPADIQNGVMNLTWQQIVGLFILAIPIATIVRTVVFEEVFREPREWCIHKSKACEKLASRKFFYLFICEYCFSHWVTLGFLILTRYKLMYDDFRGYLIAFFALVLVANFYLNAYSRLRLEITSEKKTIEETEKKIEKIDTELQESPMARRRPAGEARDQVSDGREKHKDRTT